MQLPFYPLNRPMYFKKMCNLAPQDALIDALGQLRMLFDKPPELVIQKEVHRAARQ